MEPGTRLGPYEILELLGEGGMGQVYLGNDTRLDRRVAIKVLPAEFAAHPARLARFQLEARAAAALNHPHIAAVYDIGTDADTHFMVQEYLEGHTLRTLLEERLQPLPKALALAVEMGEALTAAHEAGIIHRDLKPENVFVTRSGHAKVLDFGLAKLTEAAPLSGQSMSPTVLGTAAGQVMGTAGYMSPEQVRADREIDQRADLFAFGCVLYELATGRRAFRGETVVDTLHAITRTEPVALADIEPGLPAELGRIVRKCLAKDPADRYQAAADLVVDLRTLAGDIEAGTATSLNAVPASAPLATTATTRPESRAWTPLRLAVLATAPAVAAALAVAGLSGWWRAAAPVAPVRFEILEPPYSDSEGNGILVSPDGRTIVFGGLAEGSSGTAVHVRNLDSLEATVLPDIGSYAYPFFSPDGQWLAYRSERDLVRIGLSGVAPSTIHALPEGNFQGGDWSPEGWILISVGGALYRLPDDGAAPPALVVPRPEELGPLRHPSILPDGRSALVTLWNTSTDDSRIGIADLATGEVRDLRLDGSDPQYMPTGYLVWARHDALLAVPFDADRLETAGAPVRVQEGIEVGPAGPGKLGLSSSGTLAFSSAGASADFSLVWIDRDGNREAILTGVEEGIFAPRMSPDGTRIAMGIGPLGTMSAQVWIYEVADGAFNPFTSRAESTMANFPEWSPDGATIFYTSALADSLGIVSKPADFTGTPRTLMPGDPGAMAAAFTPDGRELVVNVGDITANVLDLYVVSLAEPEPGASARPYLTTPAGERGATLSPDGRWLAYTSDVSGEDQVYVRPFPEPGERRQVSINGGTQARWSPAGDELFYRAELATMVVDVTTEPTLRIDNRRRLHVNARALDTVYTNYDVDPSGNRFVVAERGSGAANRGGVVVVLNWDQVLRDRVPARR